MPRRVARARLAVPIGEAFDAVGIPGFQFLQDPMEYGTRTHHSSQDFYERLVPSDMRHNAVVLAAFVYLAANRDEMLPRKTVHGGVTAVGRERDGDAVALLMPATVDDPLHAVLIQPVSPGTRCAGRVRFRPSSAYRAH